MRSVRKSWTRLGLPFVWFAVWALSSIEFDSGAHTCANAPLIPVPIIQVRLQQDASGNLLTFAAHPTIQPLMPQYVVRCRPVVIFQL